LVPRGTESPSATIDQARGWDELVLALADEPGGVAWDDDEHPAVRQLTTSRTPTARSGLARLISPGAYLRDEYRVDLPSFSQ
jgi:hypothetical protein